MSLWTSSQRDRLAMERNLLKHCGMTHFDFKNPSDSSNCSLYGTIKSSYGNTYWVRIRIPDNYPIGCPEAYIEYPTIYDHDGRCLTSAGVSHSMHTLEPKGGNVHMCLYRPSNWTMNDSLVKIISKAHVWLEAYEAHRKTGRPIDDFVNSTW